MASQRKLEPNSSLHKRSHSPSERPLQHFFKIILFSTLEDKKLRIPDKFVRKFGDELSDAANIMVPNGHPWQVGLTKDQKNIWFDDGWHEFIEYHSIRDGYSLAFRYRGFSNFSVLIFDLTACEIQYPCNGPIHGEDPNCAEKCAIHCEDEMENSEATETSDSEIPIPYCCPSKGRVFYERATKGESGKINIPADKNLGTNKQRKTVGSLERPNFGHIYDTRSKKRMMEEQLEIKDCNANKSRRGKLDRHGVFSPHGCSLNEIKDSGTSKTKLGKDELLPECEEDIEIIAGEMFTSGLKNAYSRESEKAVYAARMYKPKNPSFLVMLRHCNVYNKFVYVPAGFATKYMSEVSEYIKLQVSDGREWTVRVMCTEGGGFRVGKGWNEFFRENKLEEGDVCIFELIKDNVMLKVSIFRAAQDVDLEN